MSLTKTNETLVSIPTIKRNQIKIREIGHIKLEFVKRLTNWYQDCKPRERLWSYLSRKRCEGDVREGREIKIMTFSSSKTSTYPK